MWCLIVLIISLIIARISTENRGRAIGLLQTGVSQSEVAQRLHCHQPYVARLWKKLKKNWLSQCSAAKSFHNLLKTFVLSNL